MSVQCLYSQVDLSEGFSMLDSNAYEKAIVFFETANQKKPNDKTIQICYGRALGLGGHPYAGLKILSKLYNERSDDFEVGLNFAEALMWNKQYNEAISCYRKLIHIDSSNVVAQLGCANAYAAQNNYDSALQKIDNTLALEPYNSGALNSRMHVLLAKAYLHYERRQFVSATKTVDKSLILYPNNQAAHQLKGMIRDKTSFGLDYHYFLTRDSELNRSRSHLVSTKIPVGYKGDLGMYYSHIDVTSPYENEVAKHEILFLNYTHHYSPRLNVNFGLGWNFVDKSKVRYVRNPKIKTAISYKLNNDSRIQLWYHNEVHNYNYELLNSGLVLHNIDLKYGTKLFESLFTDITLEYTLLSDTNRKHGASINSYIKNEGYPGKVGMMYVVQNFEKQRSELYFSPQLYQHLEVYVCIDNLDTYQRFKYRFFSSFGYQKSDQSAFQKIIKLELELGYSVNNEMRLMLYFLKSNINTKIKAIDYKIEGLRLGVSLQL